MGQGGRLIFDIREMRKNLSLKGYIATANIEKTFNSLCILFDLLVLKIWSWECLYKIG